MGGAGETIHPANTEERIVAITQGRVQRIGYRDRVCDETFDTDIPGWVKNSYTQKKIGLYPTSPPLS